MDAEIGIRRIVGHKQTEDVWEQGAEDNIWSKER
jgi:hypothetical protein